MTQKKINFEKLYRSLESPEKWKAFRQEQIADVAGDINRAKCEKFSDYMTDQFINTCNDKEIAGRFKNWEQKSDSEKLKLASDIVRIFLQNIKSDIAGHRVPFYEQDAGESFKTNEASSKGVDANMPEIPTISIKPMPNDKADGTSMMYVSNNKDLCININHPVYKQSPAEFLADLRHELTHVIDMFIPELSPLDKDVREKSVMFYVNAKENSELYKNNPLELNANTKRQEYKQYIEAMLVMQTINQNRVQNMNFLNMGLRGLGR
ncbi:MAG: hypothetical protein J5742_01750 [Alphaproteobacteria bacterium]|nr:hypothetical protein [Alphaproteobacteria bacterium]